MKHAYRIKRPKRVWKANKKYWSNEKRKEVNAVKAAKGDHNRWFWESFTYCLVDIYYPGPYVNSPENDKETLNAWDHETAVEALLRANKIDWSHAYSWPDGSCYKYVRCESISDIKGRLNKAFEGTEYRVNRVTEYPFHTLHNGRVLAEIFGL